MNKLQLTPIKSCQAFISIFGAFTPLQEPWWEQHRGKNGFGSIAIPAYTKIQVYPWFFYQQGEWNYSAQEPGSVSLQEWGDFARWRFRWNKIQRDFSSKQNRRKQGWSKHWNKSSLTLFCIKIHPQEQPIPWNHWVLSQLLKGNSSKGEKPTQSQSTKLVLWIKTKQQEWNKNKGFPKEASITHVINMDNMNSNSFICKSSSPS